MRCHNYPLKFLIRIFIFACFLFFALFGKTGEKLFVVVIVISTTRGWTASLLHVLNETSFLRTQQVHLQYPKLNVLYQKPSILMIDSFWWLGEDSDPQIVFVEKLHRNPPTESTSVAFVQCYESVIHCCFLEMSSVRFDLLVRQLDRNFQGLHSQSLFHLFVNGPNSFPLALVPRGASSGVLMKKAAFNFPSVPRGNGRPQMCRTLAL